MKIVYIKETNITDKICIAVAVLNILFIPADQLFNSANLVSIYGFFLFVAVIMAVGAGFVISEKKKFREDKEFIINNGYKCRGEVIRCIRHRRNDKWYRKLRIRYYSQILGKDVTFDTDDIGVLLEEKEGMYCTVYETPATEYKRRRYAQSGYLSGSSCRIEGSDPDFEPIEISFVADELENAELRKTRPYEVLLVIAFLAFFAWAAVWILKDNGTIK